MSVPYQAVIANEKFSVSLIVNEMMICFVLFLFREHRELAVAVGQARERGVAKQPREEQHKHYAPSWSP